MDSQVPVTRNEFVVQWMNLAFFIRYCMSLAAKSGEFLSPGQAESCFLYLGSQTERRDGLHGVEILVPMFKYPWPYKTDNPDSIQCLIRGLDPESPGVQMVQSGCTN